MALQTPRAKTSSLTECPPLGKPALRFPEGVTFRMAFTGDLLECAGAPSVVDLPSAVAKLLGEDVSPMELVFTSLSAEIIHGPNDPLVPCLTDIGVSVRSRARPSNRPGPGSWQGAGAFLRSPSDE